MQIQYVLNDGDFMARNQRPLVSNRSAISTIQNQTHLNKQLDHQVLFKLRDQQYKNYILYFHTKWDKKRCNKTYKTRWVVILDGFSVSERL